MTVFSKGKMIMREIMNLRPLFEKDFQKVAHDISCCAGTIKSYCGGSMNATFYWMDDCMDVLRRDTRFRHETKRAFNAAIQERVKMQRNLLYPPKGELTFFDPKEIKSEYLVRFKQDITREDFFEFWQAMGGQLYAKTLPLIKALCWKYERVLTRNNVTNPHPLAMCMTCEFLFAICQNVFNASIDRCNEDAPVMNVPYRQMFCRFNIKPVSDAWSKAVSTIVPEFLLSDEEDHDITSATDAIVEIWADPQTFLTLESEIMLDFNTEIMRSKETTIKHHEILMAKIQSMKEEARQKQLENLKQEWEKKNLTSGTPT